MISIDSKIVTQVLPMLILVGVAWGASMNRLYAVEETQEKMSEKIEDITRLKVELEYIKVQVQQNSKKLDTILEKVK
jgi:F0F1-type ATP synthase membrane subunit b/b'